MLRHLGENSIKQETRMYGLLNICPSSNNINGNITTPHIQTPNDQYKALKTWAMLYKAMKLDDIQIYINPSQSNRINQTFYRIYQGFSTHNIITIIRNGMPRY